jgi:hypothetical protein
MQPLEDDRLIADNQTSTFDAAAFAALIEESYRRKAGQSDPSSMVDE